MCSIHNKSLKNSDQEYIRCNILIRNQQFSIYWKLYFYGIKHLFLKYVVSNI